MSVTSPSNSCYPKLPTPVYERVVDIPCMAPDGNYVFEDETYAQLDQTVDSVICFLFDGTDYTMPPVTYPDEALDEVIGKTKSISVEILQLSPISPDSQYSSHSISPQSDEQDYSKSRSPSPPYSNPTVNPGLMRPDSASSESPLSPPYTPQSMSGRNICMEVPGQMPMYGRHAIPSQAFGYPPGYMMVPMGQPLYYVPQGFPMHQVPYHVPQQGYPTPAQGYGVPHQYQQTQMMHPPYPNQRHAGSPYPATRMDHPPQMMQPVDSQADLPSPPQIMQRVQAPTAGMLLKPEPQALYRPPHRFQAAPPPFLKPAQSKKELRPTSVDTKNVRGGKSSWKNPHLYKTIPCRIEAKLGRGIVLMAVTVVMLMSQIANNLSRK